MISGSAGISTPGSVADPAEPDHPTTRHRPPGRPGGQGSDRQPRHHHRSADLDQAGGDRRRRHRARGGRRGAQGASSAVLGSDITVDDHRATTWAPERWHATGETLPDARAGRDPRSTTPSCWAPSATPACPAGCSSVGCCCGCVSSSTTTSTCARPGSTRVSPRRWRTPARSTSSSSVRAPRAPTSATAARCASAPRTRSPPRSASTPPSASSGWSVTRFARGQPAARAST